MNLATSEKFREWLYKNYPIGNGKMLVGFEEDMNVLEQYLDDMNLPADTELDD